MEEHLKTGENLQIHPEEVEHPVEEENLPAEEVEHPVGGNLPVEEVERQEEENHPEEAEADYQMTGHLNWMEKSAVLKAVGETFRYNHSFYHLGV